MKVLQHTVLFTLDKIDDKTWSKIQAIANELGKLPGVISFSFQPAEVGLYKEHEDRRGGYTHILISVFKDESALKHYDESKAHGEWKQVIKPHLTKPVLAFDSWQHNFPEFALFGHTMASKPGLATAEPGGWVTK
ncbi:hypothetical protein RFI_14943 [Reticulomyxa filosa]|uniref:Stress-response A/B barrel domain-containing protein n=1 Tax=Reticulomyxa filosa TaxID=46433 RepID=X6N915_RETFI|nr:hypothetical protein RFI_14943 [Reticulomyxa filosa]|eukprot:ETO22254.1 hypothetical protein RFI_14943 [Reticulomyxa filosa]